MWCCVLHDSLTLHWCKLVTYVFTLSYALACIMELYCGWCVAQFCLPVGDHRGKWASCLTGIKSCAAPVEMNNEWVNVIRFCRFKESRGRFKCSTAERWLGKSFCWFVTLTLIQPGGLNHVRVIFLHQLVKMENPFKEPQRGCILCNTTVDYKNIQVSEEAPVFRLTVSVFSESEIPPGWEETVMQVKTRTITA